METKKIVKKRFNFKKFLILILFIYLIVYSTYYLFKVPIKNIIITGNDLVSDADIIERANIKNYPSIFSLNKTKLIKNIKTNPLINTVKIKRNLKFQLYITVSENKILMLNKTNNELLLGNGKYIANSNEYVGVPSLNNYTPEDILNSFALELGKIDKSIISSISEIEYAPSKNDKNETIDSTRFLLKMNDGNTVYTNTDKCNILNYYHQIYASLNDKKGVLNLDSGNYVNFVFQQYGA